MKIDIFNHVLPPNYLELVQRHSKEPGLVKRLTGLRLLWDIEARMAMLEEWPDVQQILTLSLPPPDALCGPEDSPHAAQIANDGLAEICQRWRARFPAFVASLPMNNVPAAMAEMDRAIDVLGARGIQICTNVNGQPLDDEKFFPVFERATQHHKVAIWMHPVRPSTFADYKSEAASRYEIWQVLGWPYETSAAMARIVFSGMFDRLPDMQIITHHCGGMLPFFSGRAKTLWAQLGSRTTDEDYKIVLQRMTKPLIDYFKMFIGDTVLGGDASALRCGLDFFGPERVVFASDCPFDPEGGSMFIRDGIRSIESLGLSDEIKNRIYLDNARRLLKFEMNDCC